MLLRGPPIDLGRTVTVNESNLWLAGRSQDSPPPAQDDIGSESSYPLQRQTAVPRAMKGLEQAVNIKLWCGNGETAKPWGKLKQDPELWDETGDTLVYFNRDRLEPSFRIWSSSLRDLESSVVDQMLYYASIEVRTSDIQIPGISYKLYIAAPAIGSKIDILRYHVTTRNFFAFLSRKSVVGFTFYQALFDLHARLCEYMPSTIDCALALRSYLVELGLVNVCNEPRAAAGLLAWSEDVRWNEGWREAFVHCVGMYEQVVQVQESADISSPTKAHLDRAYLELQARINEAENSLSNFYFDDAHFSQDDLSPTVRAASDRFRKFLKTFYEKEYQTWPIKKGRPGLWLDRTIANRLQEDFNALYEYIVDRDVTWNDKLDISDRSKRYQLTSATCDDFRLDAEDFRMLGVFQNLDCRLNTSDIPHPYPLLPISILAPQATRKSLFKGRKQDKARESRVAHVYVEACNAFQLGREYADNALARAFVQFERDDQPGEVDPRESRRERWIIIYCVLQVVAGISVDVPGLSFKDNVNYFLNARLEGLPPWSPSEKIFVEASRKQSHCWTTAETWPKGHYDGCASPRRSHSATRSHLVYENRPLMPPSPSTHSSYSGSNPHAKSGQWEATDLDFSTNEANSARTSYSQMDNNSSITGPSTRRTVSSYRDFESSPLAATEATSDSRNRGFAPDYRSVPAKFAEVAGLYSKKPLPLRPGQGAKSGPQFPMPPRR